MSASFPTGTRVAYLADHAYASLTAVPASRVLVLPDSVTTQQAAAALLQGLTALTFIREAAEIKEGQNPWVLVHAAAGGVGTWLVQLLAALGARVIGTASSEEKCEIARKNGAGWVVKSRGEDVVARVKEITGGEGVDVVFDGVGKATFDGDLDMVRRKGTVVMVGNAVSGRTCRWKSCGVSYGADNVNMNSPELFRPSIFSGWVRRISSSSVPCCSTTSRRPRSLRLTPKSCSRLFNPARSTSRYTTCIPCRTSRRRTPIWRAGTRRENCC